MAVDPSTVQEFMGHKSIEMTVRYSHLAPKLTLAAVERLLAPANPPETSTGILPVRALEHRMPYTRTPSHTILKKKNRV